MSSGSHISVCLKQHEVVAGSNADRSHSAIALMITYGITADSFMNIFWEIWHPKCYVVSLLGKRFDCPSLRQISDGDTHSCIKLEPHVTAERDEFSRRYEPPCELPDSYGFGNTT